MLKLEREIFPAPLLQNEMTSPQKNESYTNILFLQILGTNDVTVDYYPASEYIEFDSTEQIEHEIHKLENSKETIQFPLIKKAIEEINKDKQQKPNIYLGIILTDQREWAEKTIDKNENKEEWQQIVICDGHWWKNILGQWVEKEDSNITYCPIPFEVTESNIETGAADWEGMAKNLEIMLLDLVEINSSSKQVFLNYKEQPKTKIDKIIIQYSSGTPALSSALYLWGIETNQKLNLLQEKICSLEFAYLSRQDSIISTHDGDHWQWRLKVPQLEKLLEIQDFSGVLTLLNSSKQKENSNQEIKENSDKKIKNKCKIYELLEKLDRANSFNLTQLNFEKPEDEIIERISLAIWSEKAFREKGHWLQWYLRLAGAFELSILALMKAQCSDDSIRWEKETENGIELVKLKYIGQSKSGEEKGEIAFKDKNIVFGWLENGSNNENGNSTLKIEGKTITIKGELYKINQNKKYNKKEWKELKEFYGIKKDKKEKQVWECSEGNFKGFSLLRNKLYHTLQGDFIDKELDTLTKNLEKATHKDHPASIAVDKLEYILKLANLCDKVKERVDYYKTMVKEVEKSLKQAPTEKALDENC